jgi:benzaldehyde dehydrogenase (NAD)
MDESVWRGKIFSGGASGTGARFGGAANLEAFTNTRWVTIRGDIAPYPF